MVTEISWWIRLASFASVAWHRYLLPNLGSSSRHPLDPEQHYLLQAIDLGLYFESKAMCEDEWRHNITIASDNLKHDDVDWVFGSHQYQCILRGWNEPTRVLWVHYLIMAGFFSYEKIQSMFGWRGCLSLFKSFATQSFLLSFMACDKNWPFLILYEK